MACPFPSAFPTWVYHPGGASKVVRTVDEFEQLEPEWSDTPFIIPPPVSHAPIVYSEAELQVAELTALVDGLNAKVKGLEFDNADLRQRVLARDREITDLKNDVLLREMALDDARKAASAAAVADEPPVEVLVPAEPRGGRGKR